MIMIDRHSVADEESTAKNGKIESSQNHHFARMLIRESVLGHIDE